MYKVLCIPRFQPNHSISILFSAQINTNWVPISISTRLSIHSVWSTLSHFCFVLWCATPSAHRSRRVSYCNYISYSSRFLEPIRASVWNLSVLSTNQHHDSFPPSPIMLWYYPSSSRWPLLLPHSPDWLGRTSRSGLNCSMIMQLAFDNRNANENTSRPGRAREIENRLVVPSLLAY